MQQGPAQRKRRRRWAWVRRPQEVYPDFYFRYSHDIAHVFGLRIFGIYAIDGRVKVRRWQVIANILLIFTPILLGLFLPAAVAHAKNLTSLFWLAYFAMLALVVQTFSLGGVHVFHGLTPELEKCLTKTGIRRYEGWAAVSTAFVPQLINAIVWVAAGCLALKLLSLEPSIRTSLSIDWLSYASVAISVTYLSGGIWWIFAGSILAWRLSGEGCMRLNPYAPAETPGIELLVRCYRLTFIGACIGVLLCLTPIISWTAMLSSSAVALAVGGALTVLSFFALLTVSIVPDWMLSKSIMRERHELLTRLEQYLPSNPSHVPSVSSLDSFHQAWMQTLVSSPRSTISGSVIVTFIAALLSAVIPIIAGMVITPR